MNNKILQGYLSDFRSDFNFPENIKEDVLFEHFVNYCVLSKVHPEAFYNDSFKVEEINIGGGQDSGIDGVAIVVNEHIVSSKEEVDSLKNELQRLEVRFIFTQAKTSAEFKSSDIGNFLFGVKEFFKEDSSLVISEDIQNLKGIKDYIYTQSIYMDESPLCELHYVTTGKWTNDQNVLGRVEAEVNELRNRGLFRDIKFLPTDAEKLERVYKEIKNKITKEINFEKHTPLPRIEGVKEAYIGILPAGEYLKLIADSDGKMQRTLFYDNIRDYMGLTPVNREIQITVQSREKQLKFPIFNNGITIVAKNLNKVGTYFKIKDFQVVNGCQTSNILYNNKQHVDKVNTYIPIKLIVSDNQEVINDIIKATNRQTEVKNEAFESLKEYHKKLQSFYDSFPRDTKLYYERRPREYDTVFPPIPRTRIMTLSAQINAVISMFYNVPHSTHRYYGELLKAYSGNLFLDDHNPYIYYVSTCCLNKVDILLKQNFIPSYYRHYKYHLLTVYRIIAGGYSYPAFNSKDINAYCEGIYKTLQNESETKRIVKQSTDCIRLGINSFVVKHGPKNINDFKRLKDVTFEVIEQAKLVDSNSGRAKKMKQGG